jgi:hypothetical protein
MRMRAKEKKGDTNPELPPASGGGGYGDGDERGGGGYGDGDERERERGHERSLRAEAEAEAEAVLLLRSVAITPERNYLQVEEGWLLLQEDEIEFAGLGYGPLWAWRPACT